MCAEKPLESCFYIYYHLLCKSVTSIILKYWYLLSQTSKNEGERNSWVMFFSLPHLLLLISFETRQRKLQRNSYSQMALYSVQESGMLRQARQGSELTLQRIPTKRWTPTCRRYGDVTRNGKRVSLDDLISSSHSLCGALVISDPYFTNVWGRQGVKQKKTTRTRDNWEPEPWLR